MQTQLPTRFSSGRALLPREIKPEVAAMGRRIQVSRENAGLSQQQVTIKLNDAGVEVTRSAYGHWENGRSDIPSSSLLILAKILGVSAGYIIGEESQVEWVDERAAHFFNGTDPELQEIGLAQLRTLFEISDRKRTTHGRKATIDEDAAGTDAAPK